MNKEKRKRSSAVYRLITVALLCVIVFCLFKIGSILSEYQEGTRQYTRLQEIAEVDVKGIENINFEALRKENSDVKGWIYSEDTVINYPVVQGSDNEYYLYRTALKEWNSKGSIFIDYRCRRPFKSFNTVLYGHRMKDGSMFHSLTKYEKQDYYRKHPVMELILPDAGYELEIFGAVRIPSDSPMYKFSFSDAAEKQDYLDWIAENSLIDTEVKVSPEDRIVMLSTCTYEFEDARMVVYGRLAEKTQ